MAKMTLEYAEAKIFIDGSDALIERERVAFYDFVRSLKPDMSSEKCQRQKSEQKCKSVPTWAELKEAADERRLSELVKSGDRLPLTLKNGEKVDLDVGRDERGKTFFIFHHLMKDTHYMNEYPTNSGGWRDCDMRLYQNEDLFRLLPNEVQEVVVPTPIVQVIDGERIEIRDKLFALSTTQVFGRDDFFKFEPEDSQIDIFQNQKNRRKTVPEEGAMPWWLRSPFYNITDYFCIVSTDGSNNNTSASYSAGVTAAFCID